MSKGFKLIPCLVVALLLLVGCAQEGVPLSTEELWQGAVEDSMTADSDEIMKLVELTPDDERVTWDATGERVLLLSWNRYPESYPQGKTMNLEWGEVWTFTSKEITSWYESNAEEAASWDEEGWNLRLEQLIGLPEDAEYTHFTAFWADPEDVIRPAYVTDVTSQMTNDYADIEDSEYRQWFDSNIIWSYFESEYPWTRLGYTYDWADDGTEYGLTEFLILKDSPVEIEFTYTTDEFIDWLEAQV